MNKLTQLIVHYDQNNIKQIRLIMPLMIIIMLLLLYSLPQINLNYISNFLLGFFIKIIQVIIYFCISLFALGTVYTFFMKSTTPAAILNQEGIWFKRYGLIPWGMVDEINLCSLPTASHIKLIGIQIKNTSLLYKQASWEGKMELFWAKIFGYSHVKLSNIEMANDVVIKFARQYIKPRM